MRLLTMIAAVAAFSTPALAHEFTKGDLSVGHPYSFETAKTARAGIGYLTIKNTGEAADTLIGVRIEGYHGELHRTETDADGVARMIHQENGVPVPAGETVVMEPGGLHVMIMGLNGDPLEEGEEVKAVLEFERAGDLPIIFNVESRGEGAKEMDHSGHKMDKTEEPKTDG